jgi:hypothetical protein
MSMNQNVSSVQEVVRDGEKHDIYYYSKHNMFVQARPTLCNNKFQQQLVSPNSGTSQLIFSPDQGLSDVIIVFALKAQGTGSDYTHYGLNRGWGYSLINNLAVRYGGSSQYFFTGQQMLMQNAIDMQDAVSRDKLFALGGSACLGTNATGGNDFDVQQNAYVYLNLPHNTPNGDGLKMSPLPTELLRQPVLIQVTLNTARNIFSSDSTAPSSSLSFDPVQEAYFQCKQVRMINSEDLLTNEEDPMKITYTYPLKYFPQQEYQLSLPANGTGQYQLNLTGFRNGGVKSILLWLTLDGDVPPAGSAVPVAVNPNLWYAPQNTILSINGEIFYNAKYGSSLLLDLVNNKQPNELACTQITPGAALSFAAGGFDAQYVKVDFSQHTDPVTSSNLLVAGKSITNSIVNLQITTPPVGGVVGGGPWTLHALYLYNSSLIFAGGNCEYSF